MNTNKDSAVQCLITACYVLSSIYTIFIFLAIFRGSWNMAWIALGSLLIMGIVLISASILADCDGYKDAPFLVCIVSCIVLAIEHLIIIVGCGILNIVKYILKFPETIFSIVTDFIRYTIFKKRDDNNEKLE